MSEDKIKLQGIMSEGYGIIPKKVMKDEDLTIDAKAIYAFMASFAGAGNTSFPSVKFITDKLGISRQRFNKHRKLLEDKGYITIKKERKSDGSWESNVYTLETLPRLQNPTLDNLTLDNPTSGNVTTNNNTINNNTINNNTDNIDHQPSDDGQSTSERFEVLWKEYPKKQGKKKALDYYKRALKNGATDEVIMQGIEDYKKYLALEKSKGWQRKPMDGSRWFNEERWNDEFDEVETNEKSWAGSDF